ncbi:MAG: relaxase/mobilization nuclease domain-containing protein [Pseudomonadota bacterium]
MILKGNSRTGGKGLVSHMLNERDNDHVEVFEVRGFATDDFAEAVHETDTIARNTRCRKCHYSLSLNPPEEAELTENEWLDAITQCEEALGLTGQPRTIIFHEKEGRRHCHVIWSRIDPETMKAIDDGHDHYKLREVSRSLYRQHGWELPPGLRDPKERQSEPSRADRATEARSGLTIHDHAEMIREAWEAADDRKSFGHALDAKGYILAKGKRGYVAIDIYTGDAHSIYRRLSMKKREVEAVIGTPDELPDVVTARKEAEQRRLALAELKADETRKEDAYKQQLSVLRERQREERDRLRHRQTQERLAHEETLFDDIERIVQVTLAHAARLRDKFMGLDNQANHWAKIDELRKTQEERWREERNQQRQDHLEERRALQRPLRAERHVNRKARMADRQRLDDQRRNDTERDEEIARKKAELEAKFQRDRETRKLER